MVKNPNKNVFVKLPNKKNFCIFFLYYSPRWWLRMLIRAKMVRWPTPSSRRVWAASSRLTRWQEASPQQPSWTVKSLPRPSENRALVKQTSAGSVLCAHVQDGRTQSSTFKSLFNCKWTRKVQYIYTLKKRKKKKFDLTRNESYSLSTCVFGQLSWRLTSSPDDMSTITRSYRQSRCMESHIKAFHPNGKWS